MTTLIIPSAIFFLLFSFCDIYEAKVLSVYDGDTITADIELGFDVRITTKIRLARIDAPEMKGKEREQGIIARDALRDKILHNTVKFNYHKRGKYGRAVGEIEYNDENINDWMVSQGYAEYANY